MLIENTQPNARQIGSLYLIPGVNRFEKKVWDAQVKKGYKKSIDTLLEKGILAICDEVKITKELIQKTYKVDILEDWLQDAKAASTKGYLRSQITLMTT